MPSCHPVSNQLFLFEKKQIYRYLLMLLLGIYLRILLYVGPKAVSLPTRNYIVYLLMWHDL